MIVYALFESKEHVCLVALLTVYYVNLPSQPNDKSIFFLGLLSSSQIKDQTIR